MLTGKCCIYCGMEGVCVFMLEIKFTISKFLLADFKIKFGALSIWHEETSEYMLITSASIFLLVRAYIFRKLLVCCTIHRVDLLCPLCMPNLRLL